ncbi:hypothetical protein [Phaffia rhodozyma]|uniref:Uncharacterized protein n=1 Tax=Phaffia rhodozyma TaxID=264483 RepID=A0A0F7SL28_PHARH|nr:hypothetical protein [Phaffia rhodozyma]
MSSRLLATHARPNISVRSHSRSITNSLPFPPSRNVPAPRQMPLALPWETAQQLQSTGRSSRSIPRYAEFKLNNTNLPAGGFQAYFDRMVKNKFELDDEAVMNVLRTFIGRYENETVGTKDDSLIAIAKQIQTDGDDKVFPNMIHRSTSTKAIRSNTEGTLKDAMRVYRLILKQLKTIPAFDPVYFSNEYNIDYNKKSWNRHFDAELAAMKQASSAQIRPIQERANEIADRLKVLIADGVSSAVEETQMLEAELRSSMKQLKELEMSLEESQQDVSEARKNKMLTLENDHRSFLSWMNGTIKKRRATLKKESDMFDSTRPTGLSNATTTNEIAEPSNLLHAVEKTVEFHKDQMFYQQLEMLYLADRFRQIALKINRPVLFKESFDLVVRTVTARRAPFNVSGPNTTLFQKVIKFAVARQLYRAMFALRSRSGSEADFKPLGPAIVYLEALLDLVKTQPDYILAKKTVLDVVSSVCENLDGATRRALLEPTTGLSGQSRSVSLETRVEPIAQFLRTAIEILKRSSSSAVASAETGLSKAQVERVSEEVGHVRKEFVLEGADSLVEVKAIGGSIKRDLEVLERAIKKLA